MAKFLSLFMLVAVFLSCKAQSKKLTVNAFEKAIESNVQILDVRTSGEFNRGHIKKALQANWNDQAEFAKRVAHIDKTKPVYVYCQAGGRSAAAAAWLTQNGYKEVYDLSGGMLAWQKENKAVEQVAAVVQYSVQDFEKMIVKDSLYLVDFGAEWCPPCVKMKPVLNNLVTANKNKFILLPIDGGIHIDLMKALGVEALPTFFVYKNGKQIFKKEGIMTKEELEKALEITK
jgi:rhodanese-related sulfurtransferase